MAGYIGVTSREWFMYLSKNNDSNEVNFWRSDTKNFKSLIQGEPFFFIVKNNKGIKGEKSVLGQAKYEKFEVISVEEAWEKYRKGNGYQTKDHFINRLQNMFPDSITDGKIGCIILSDFQTFKKPIYLSEIGVYFHENTVAGKKIEYKEVNKINNHISDMINLTEFTEDDEGFPEGKYLLKQHLIRERNNHVVKIAKENFIKNNGKLFCEICNFDFKEFYGPIGDGYIEGHHIKPISDMKENEETKVEDIALVCSNCHRMLHRKRPWLKMNELKELFKNNAYSIYS